MSILRQAQEDKLRKTSSGGQTQKDRQEDKLWRTGSGKHTQNGSKAHIELYS